jgi:hypothetical protein
MEYSAKRLYISEGARSAELHVQTTALLVVGTLQHFRDAGCRQILEAAGLLSALSVSPAMSACSTCAP